jgi:putative FmdB family regulatory protein
MPIYEYHCADCRRSVSLLVLRISDPSPPHCPRCGGEHLRRLMSRFATIRSEEDRLDSLADPSSLGDLNEDDPRSVARWMKRMGNEMGEDLGDDVDEALEEEAGSDLGSPSEAGGGDDDDL